MGCMTRKQPLRWYPVPVGGLLSLAPDFPTKKTAVAYARWRQRPYEIWRRGPRGGKTLVCRVHARPRKYVPSKDF
jgi:hypothetical protein